MLIFFSPYKATYFVSMPFFLLKTQKEFVKIWLKYWQVRESCVIQDDIEKLN